MLTCEDIQKELEAFSSGEIDESQRSQIQDHLKGCPHCAQAVRRLTRLSEVLQTWQGPEPSPRMYDALKARMKSSASLRRRNLTYPLVRKVAFQIAKVAAIVMLTLLLSHWLGFPRSRVPAEPVPETREGSTTINLYLKEHQDVVAQYAALHLSPAPAARMDVSPHDLLYYEFFEDRPEFMRPGIIVRGPSSQRKVIPSEAPVISNGHTLTLAEARKTANFDLVSPPRLHPGYMLDAIRRIEGRDALHLLYTDGINTISLFEQPLDGERGLAAQDFREYALYRSEGQGPGTILAWRDHAFSYVLIGNIEMSQLMDMAQSISAPNERE